MSFFFDPQEKHEAGLVPNFCLTLCSGDSGEILWPPFFFEKTPFFKIPHLFFFEHVRRFSMVVCTVFSLDSFCAFYSFWAEDWTFLRETKSAFLGDHT